MCKKECGLEIMQTEKADIDIWKLNINSCKINID